MHLEQRSRRNNLSIDGIKEKDRKIWEDCEAELEKFFREELGIEDKTITERADRTKNKKQKKNQPKTIICRLLNFKGKENIIKICKKLKGTCIFVNEDFS